MIKIRINLCLVFFILITATGLIFPFKSYAVPASPRIFELEQPDGTVFYARQWGDEWAHGMETTDGHSIVLDRSTKKWTYAVIDKTGKLVASKRIVGTDYPPFDTPIRPTGEARAMIRQLRASAVSQRVVPPTGTANVPVILINFNGTSYTYSSGDFDTLLFGTGSKSMKDYYDEVSYGNFSVSAGISGIAGWYTAANIHDYYGTNVSCSGTTYDQHVAELVIEAVNAADSAGFNFDPYDQDNDCYVDIVGIVHQGTGEETGGPSTDIWSHSWNLKSALSFCGDGTGAVTTNANCSANPTEKIKVNDYIIMPELYDTSPTQSTIGVFAHEYGHALGLPDLYDTDWPTDSSGIGDWGVMASGSWNAVVLSGDTPAHTSAWSKYFLGWVTPTQVITTLTNEQIDAASGNSDVYQLLNGTSTAGEYFLVENRQRTGFDAGLPGDGLLIWHIDAGQQNNNNECVDHSNCPVNHYRVALEQADNLWDLENNQNRGDAGDPFPGTQANIAFTDSTDPDSYLYNGNASNVSVTAISTSQTNMTATLVPGPPPAAPSGLSAAAVSSSRIDLSWTDNSSNEVGFKIERSLTGGGTGFSQIASVGVNVTTFPSTGLSASTEYYYRVRAYNLVGDSAYSNEANATTDAAPLAAAPAASSGGGGGGGCFIATAAYGSYMADEV
ncbi:MAG TPA: M6 family metalloprotease domain-containing protein, partial [Nitrospirae bacterium]|nr:M6 family metalloprotease domain-containing protein [Nitrospirota bacterium]